MAPPNKDSGHSGRRMSMHLFSRASTSGLTHINTDVANGSTPNSAPPLENGDKKDRKRLAKRTSIFGLGPVSSSEGLQDGTMSPTKINERSGSPRLRSRTLQKGRPSSLFGSLRRKSFNNVVDCEEGESNRLATGTPESLTEAGLLQPRNSLNKTVVYHGEIQTTGGMFRKKKEYLVLTETHLVRFKSQSRASETFPSIPQSHGRSSNTRHPSTTSIGSLQEVQSTNSNASSEGEVRIPLDQIVTVYKVEDGRPFFTTEVVYLDEEFQGVGSIQLVLQDPNEADLWHTSIRGAAQKARLLMTEPFPHRVVRYLVAALEEANDYDANHFQIFRIARRQVVPKGGRSTSSEDLQKLGTLVFYMVIGINRLHMIPIPDFSGGNLIKPKANQSAFGIAGLVSMWVNADDDRFEVAFRIPFQGAKTLDLAASATQDIATGLIREWQYLKPHWDDYTFKFTGPKRIIQSCDTRLSYEEEEFGSFERTLVAYCMAYGCNPVNIQYAVDFDCEDAPEFILCAPKHTKYTKIELLAVMRSLRYNESFRSISFRDIDLHSIHGWFDPYGTDHVAWWTRSGIHISTYFGLKPELRSVLYQEVQAIALKSQKLRRMDFTNSLPRRRPKDNFDFEEGGEVDKDPGCEIVAALFPLCRGELTGVTWISLSGIELGETDLDDLIPALHSTRAMMRAVVFSHCGLNDRGIMQMVTNLERQNATLEYINISDNPGRIDLEQFQKSVARFSKIKRLDLSRTTWTSGSHALFLPEVMLSWRLEELTLNGVPVCILCLLLRSYTETLQINENTLSSIAAYLSSDMSNNLRVLQMDQCNLTGDHVALLMQSMTRIPGEARKLEFHVSANRLEKGVSEIVEAMQANQCPTHLFLRMIEFTKEDHFRQLLQALRTNNTITVLDISKASLPYDAGPETCDELRLLFEENSTLEDLDISGEQAHLEVTRFGIGLNHALTGLKQNKTLRVLRIEYQNLGLEGANTLSSVLEENTGLTHVYCEHNDINLQGFTTLVNALARNYTVLDLPLFKDDQRVSIKKMNMSMRDSRRAVINRPQSEMKSSVRRTLTTLGGGSRKEKKAQGTDITLQDVDAVVNVLHERWEHEMHRLGVFLERNARIANGEAVAGEVGSEVSEEAMRPTTAISDRGILEQVLNNTTPRVELGNPVESIGEKLGALDVSSSDGKEVTTYARENTKLPAMGDGDEKPFIAELDGAMTMPMEMPYHENRNQNRKSGVELLPELGLGGLGGEKVFELDGEGDGEGRMFIMEN